MQDPRLKNLTLQALLYADGALNDADAAHFERRLAHEQSAREALGEAVQLSSVLRGQPVAVPRTGWRARVRRRLRPTLWQRLNQPVAFRDHPWGWSLAGAAAVLLMVWLNMPHSTARSPTGPVRAHARQGHRGLDRQAWCERHQALHVAQSRDTIEIRSGAEGPSPAMSAFGCFHLTREQKHELCHGLSNCRARR
jgi:hypothetical protein